VIADLGSHALDLVQFLLGDYVAVLGGTLIAYRERPSAGDPARAVRVDAEDCMMALARMRSGALGSIEATKVATGAEDEMRFEIHGSRGALRYNQMDPHHLEYYDAGAAGDPIGGVRGWTKIATGQRYPAPATGFPASKVSIGWLRSHVACLANFLEGVAKGKRVKPDLEDGIRVQHLMECIRASVVQRRWIDVP